MSGPLRGVRVLDLSTIVAGPMATQIMADQGADVIKVEAPPIGDRGRNPGSSRNGVSATFHIFNRGKRSIMLDLKAPAGLELMRRLIGQTDVLLHNFRPKVMARLGLDYESLRGGHPELVYVAISGFGDEGPMADRPAYDHMVQCYAGFAALQADPKTGADADGGGPSLIRNVVVDKLTALTAAQAVTAALYARAGGAGGQEVKLSMLGSAIAFLWPDAAVKNHLVGEGAQLKPSMADFCRLYRFKNGYATFSASDASFAGLCRVLKAPAGNDPRLQDSVGRLKELALMAEVERQLAAAAAELDVDEGIALLEANDVPCAKVLSLEDLPDHPQVRANGYLRIAEHPVAGPIIEPRPAADFSATPVEPTGPAPGLGEQTDAILAELGLDSDAVAGLRAQGAVG